MVHFTLDYVILDLVYHTAFQKQLYKCMFGRFSTQFLESEDEVGETLFCG
jgi:hypothetical protein